MKITMYELLGLIKDNKAPKKIKYNNIELEYNKENEDYFKYYGIGLFEYKFETSTQFLNDYVEIIEEPKKIEKINLKYWDDSECTPEQRINVCMTYINELIDEINNLKEK